MKHCPNPHCSFLARMDMVAEYQDHVERCLDCGAQLVPGEAPAAPPAVAPQQGPPLVVVATFLRVLEANAWRARLEAAGIPAFVADENVGYIYGGFDAYVTGGVRLMVPEPDAEQARQLLDEVEG